LPGGQPFISVIDAVPGDGFNPIWEEVQITFTEGKHASQLFSIMKSLPLPMPAKLRSLPRVKFIGVRSLEKNIKS